MLAMQVAIPNPVEGLLGYASGFVTVYALSVVKRYTTLADTGIGKALKPVQPWIATAAALLVPFLAQRIGMQVDAQQFVAAPVGTVVAIGAAELLSKLQGSERRP